MVRKKGGGRLPGKVTLPSLEGYTALMHVTPRAKGMAIAMPVKPITQQNIKAWLKGCPDLYCSCIQPQN